MMEKSMLSLLITFSLQLLLKRKSEDQAADS
jgi:hypothetical protein